MYVIELSQRVQRFLDKLDNYLKNRIEKSLKRLKTNPISNNTKFIKRENNDKIFRYRIGNYRVLYSVNESKKLILLINLDKRSKVYD